MSLLHIRGAQPSKKAKQPRRNLSQACISPLLKNVQNVTRAKNKASLSSPSFGKNNMMDLKSFQFFMDNFNNSSQQQQQQQHQNRLAINTQECKHFLQKHNVKFIVERTQEISSSKVFITTRVKKRNMATFVLQLPDNYSNGRENDVMCRLDFLVLLLLTRIDFGTLQIEFAPNVGRSVQKMLQMSKEFGFKFFYNFISINLHSKRFIIVRHQF